ncbi:MAG: glycosyltransferase [Pirellulales bacterium]|nr:glycosyltransferase [Pirellulales bacterium]
MKISVAICTWNRADLLDRTLREMRTLQIPCEVEWELLIVNNNCTDQTDEVLARHKQHLPIRRLFEPIQGIARARNFAARAATGELLVWTDDDVLVEPGWLVAYYNAYVQFPEAGFYGGAVEPWFGAEPPKWIRDNLSRVEGAYAIRRLTSETRWMNDQDLPVNANMAVKRSLMEAFAYANHLGAQGDSLMRGEETELVHQFRSSGFQGMWVSGAGVRHYIPRDRLTASYIWRLSYGSGRTSVRMNGSPPCPCFLGAPRWAIKQYCQKRLWSCLLTPWKSTRWLDAFISAAQLKGFIDECRASTISH